MLPADEESRSKKIVPTLGVTIQPNHVRKIRFNFQTHVTCWSGSERGLSRQTGDVLSHATHLQLYPEPNPDKSPPSRVREIVEGFRRVLANKRVVIMICQVTNLLTEGLVPLVFRGECHQQRERRCSGPWIGRR